MVSVLVSMRCPLPFLLRWDSCRSWRICWQQREAVSQQGTAVGMWFGEGLHIILRILRLQTFISIRGRKPGIHLLPHYHKLKPQPLHSLNGATRQIGVPRLPPPRLKWSLKCQTSSLVLQLSQASPTKLDRVSLVLSRVQPLPLLILRCS